MPRQDNADASYTQTTYNLNHPRKVAMRRFRRETIEECLDLLAQGQSILGRLLEKAVRARGPELAGEIKVIEDALHRAWRDLEVFEVVPRDAQASCACRVDDGRCSIPRILGEQTIEVEAVAGARAV